MRHDISQSFGNASLRQIELSDIESLRAWRNDADNSRYIRKIPYVTPEMQNSWYTAYLDNDREYGFAIENEIGKLVGSVFLYNLESNSAEFGRLLVGECKGHGYGGNATIATTSIAFCQLGLNELRATVSVENLPALMVYTRVGFLIVGKSWNESAAADEYRILLTADRFKRLWGDRLIEARAR